MTKRTVLTRGDDDYTLTYHDEEVHAGEGNDTIWISPYRWWDDNLTNSSFDLWDLWPEALKFRPGEVFGPPPNQSILPAVYGEGGNDFIVGSDYSDLIDGGSEDDFIITGAGEDVVLGGSGDDTVVLVDASKADSYHYDWLDGGEGFDFLELHYNGTAEFGFGLVGGSSNMITARNFEQLSYYGSDAARDVVSGGGADDRFRTYGGNDEISGLGGDDVIDAGEGADSVNGGDGNDRILAGGGADTVVGSLGNDNVEGGAGNDILYGDYAVNYVGVAGDDTIIGGAGRDIMYGFGGRDTFVFRAVSESPAVYRDPPSSPSATPLLDLADAISGFQHGLDRIDLRAIDADGNAANGDQAFFFHGGGAFLGTRGELIDRVSGDGTHVLMGDVDGDRVADFAVGLPGLNGLLGLSDLML